MGRCATGVEERSCEQRGEQRPQRSSAHGGLQLHSVRRMQRTRGAPKSERARCGVSADLKRRETPPGGRASAVPVLSCGVPAAAALTWRLQPARGIARQKSTACSSGCLWNAVLDYALMYRHGRIFRGLNLQGAKPTRALLGQDAMMLCPRCEPRLFSHIGEDNCGAFSDLRAAMTTQRWERWLVPRAFSTTVLSVLRC